MSRKNISSADKLLRDCIGSCLLTIIFLSVLFVAEGQEKPQLSEPFQKCRVYGINNGLSQIVASDNESNLILSNDNLTLTSINVFNNVENWKTQITGKLEPTALSDKENLYFISSFESEKKEKRFVITAISLQTGITAWQKKSFNDFNSKIIQVEGEKLLYVIADNKTILALKKSNGNILWTKDFKNEIISLSNQTEDQINVLLDNRLEILSAKTGELIKVLKLEKGSASNSLIKNTYILLGYKTGEFIKASSEKNKPAILWKIKTGGSISGLFEINKEVLVTSLDNFLYLFSIESGNLIWKRRVSGRINIKPLLFENYAVVINSADNTASIIELKEGKVINQVRIEDDNHFSGQPAIFGNYIVFQTFRGIYLFANSGITCK